MNADICHVENGHQHDDSGNGDKAMIIRSILGCIDNGSSSS